MTLMLTVPASSCLSTYKAFSFPVGRRVGQEAKKPMLYRLVQRFRKP
jgi:hypothetical protein